MIQLTLNQLGHIKYLPYVGTIAIFRVRSKPNLERSPYPSSTSALTAALWGPGARLEGLSEETALPVCTGSNFFFLRPHVRRMEVARRQIGAAAAGLDHSRSNARSQPHLPPTPQLVAELDGQPTERGQGLNPHPPHGY